MANPFHKKSSGQILAQSRPFIGCRVSRAAALSLNTSTSTKIIWDAQRLDPFNMHDNVVNPTRVTPGRRGVWLAHGQIAYAANATNNRVVGIYLNGVLVTYHVVPVAGGSQVTVAAVSDLIETTAATDFIELEGWQNSGGSLALDVNNYFTYFSVTFLGL